LNQEDIKHLNRSRTINEIESVIRSLSKKKSTGLYNFTVELYQIFKEELTPMFLKVFHKKRKGCYRTCLMKPVLPYSKPR
jgi:hypothetical protein